MANVCETKITVIGVKEAAEIFVKALSKATFGIDLDNLEPKQWGENISADGKTWYSTLVTEFREQRYRRYCILYPYGPYSRLGLTAPRFYVETKWKPPVAEIREASKAFPDLTFHLDWWLEQDGPSGELVVQNGNDIEELIRPASWYLFDHTILYPTISLLPTHLPYTLAQRGSLRLEDAIQAIDDLIRVLDDDRFRNSPFTEYRDVQKTGALSEGLTALRFVMTESAKQLDFEGVFLERQELIDKFPHVIEADKALIRSFGLEPLPIEAGKTLRISILPLKAGINDAPHRIIIPVLHYVNADPTSGKYAQDGESPIPVEWEIRYLCLREIDAARIRMLPDQDQTPCDIDLTVTPDTTNGFGYNISRISKQARWRRDPEIANEVQREGGKIDTEFDAKFASVPGLRIFNDFRSASKSLQD
jgi:hypothetical protein